MTLGVWSVHGTAVTVTVTGALFPTLGARHKYCPSSRASTIGTTRSLLEHLNLDEGSMG